MKDSHLPWKASKVELKFTFEDSSNFGRIDTYSKIYIKLLKWEKEIYSQTSDGNEFWFYISGTPCVFPDFNIQYIPKHLEILDNNYILRSAKSYYLRFDDQ